MGTHPTPILYKSDSLVYPIHYPSPISSSGRSVGQSVLRYTEGETLYYELHKNYGHTKTVSHDAT